MLTEIYGSFAKKNKESLEKFCSIIFMQGGKLTVKQVTSLDSRSSILHFQYKLNNQLSWSMRSVLSGHSLFVGIPDGELLKGTKEGYVINVKYALCSTIRSKASVEGILIKYAHAW